MSFVQRLATWVFAHPIATDDQHHDIATSKFFPSGVFGDGRTGWRRGCWLVVAVGVALSMYEWSWAPLESYTHNCKHSLENVLPHYVALCLLVFTVVCDTRTPSS